jgi:peroxiredoxin Q/BCP
MATLHSSAPAFALPSTDGTTVRLDDLRGAPVVLYFYPRDDTPGCTREACDFRDRHARIAKTGARILGVSSDPLARHAKFREKYSLPFDLLVDEGNRVAKAYGAYGEKTLYGKKTLGTIRSTFVIDAKGKIAAKWSPVRVDGHADAVLAALAGADAGAQAKMRAPAAGKRRAKRSTTAKPRR